VYSTYAATSILLESGIWVAEQAAKISQQIAIPETVQNTIAEKLGFDVEQTAQFKQDIQDENGKATLISLEEYLNTYFKNMTAEQRAEAQQVFDEVLTIAKNLAADVDAMVDKEYKDAFTGLIEDMEDEIPEALKLVAGNAINRFKGTLERMQAAVEGEEPLAGAYAALKELEKDKAQVLAAIQAELDDADRKAVETSIQNAESMFAGFERVMSEKLERAEEAAKQFLAEAKAARENANAA
jgi:LytS/YehU family sensor histidine kinase